MGPGQDNQKISCSSTNRYEGHRHKRQKLADGPLSISTCAIRYPLCAYVPKNNGHVGRGPMIWKHISNMHKQGKKREVRGYQGAVDDEHTEDMLESRDEDSE